MLPKIYHSVSDGKKKNASIVLEHGGGGSCTCLKAAAVTVFIVNEKRTTQQFLHVSDIPSDFLAYTDLLEVICVLTINLMPSLLKDLEKKACRFT